MSDWLQALMNAADLSLNFLCKTVPFMVFGIVLAEFVVAMKFMDKIAFITKPITNFAHLSSECGTSFVTAFVSPTSANSMLAAFYNDGKIERRELFIASLVNSFPAIVMHWRSVLPVLIPLLGSVGVIYFSILMLVGLIKTLLVMLAGRILLVKKQTFSIQNDPEKPNIADALKISLKNSVKTVKKVLTTTIPTTFITFILYEMGAFEVLTDYLSPASRYFPIPPEGLTIISAYFGNYIAAATVAGNLLSAGRLTGKDVILSLLVGNVLSAFPAMLRYETPYYVGIFGPKNGTQIMLLSTAIRTGIMLGVILALCYWG